VDCPQFLAVQRWHDDFNTSAARAESVFYTGNGWSDLVCANRPLPDVRERSRRFVFNVHPAASAKDYMGRCSLHAAGSLHGSRAYLSVAARYPCKLAVGWHRACICQLAVDCCFAGPPTLCPGGKWFLDKVSLGACRNKLDPDDRVDCSRASHDDNRLLPNSLLGCKGGFQLKSSLFLWQFSRIKQSRLLGDYPGSTASRGLFRLSVLKATHTATLFSAGLPGH